jgi:hypothetical protein
MCASASGNAASAECNGASPDAWVTSANGNPAWTDGTWLGGWERGIGEWEGGIGEAEDETWMRFGPCSRRFKAAMLTNVLMVGLSLIRAVASVVIVYRMPPDTSPLAAATPVVRGEADFK